MICPIMSRLVVTKALNRDYDRADLAKQECLKKDCALWRSVITNYPLIGRRILEEWCGLIK